MSDKMPGPSLQYLTIYNPTLKPAGITEEDDEDAEEQAQILFYTSGERAVSRDRMLRQVGLAKALVNFSSYVSNERDPCLSLNVEQHVPQCRLLQSHSFSNSQNDHVLSRAGLLDSRSEYVEFQPSPY